MANSLGDAILWLGRQWHRLVAGIKADFKLRAAEAQLFRMSDRELADIGLCRGDITFADPRGRARRGSRDRPRLWSRHRGQPEFAPCGVNCL